MSGTTYIPKTHLRASRGEHESPIAFYEQELRVKVNMTTSMESVNIKTSPEGYQYIEDNVDLKKIVRFGSNLYAMSADPPLIIPVGSQNIGWKMVLSLNEEMEGCKSDEVHDAYLDVFAIISENKGFLSKHRFLEAYGKYRTKYTNYFISKGWRKPQESQQVSSPSEERSSEPQKSKGSSKMSESSPQRRRSRRGASPKVRYPEITMRCPTSVWGSAFGRSIR